MLKWKNAALFNVEEIEERQDGAVLLRRFPKNVQDSFGDKMFVNKYVARMTTGCEIRLVSDGAAVTVSAWDADGVVEVYKGDYFVKTVTVPCGRTTTIFLGDVSIKMGEYDMLPHRGRFAPWVWRIVFAHDFCGILHDIEPVTPIRPPAPNELPAKTILAYGSSITHGACSMVFSNAYIARAAQALNMDVLNKGMGGSCFCEKEVADYIADAEWDAAVLELAVNMLGKFSPEEYEKRAGYVLSRALSTGKPVVFISHFRHFRDLPDEKEAQAALNAEFRKKAEILSQRYACENLLYIDGRELLDDYKLLTADLIHPSVYGHSVIGHRLAEKMVKFLEFISWRRCL